MNPYQQNQQYYRQQLTYQQQQHGSIQSTPSSLYNQVHSTPSTLYNQQAVQGPNSTFSPNTSYSNTTYPSLQRSNTFSIVDQRERYLWDLFQRIDADRSGSISVHELQSALVNGDWSPFNIETVRMMIGIFDTDNNGSVDFREFHRLWKYVEDWSNCFKKFDQDGSGSIDRFEMGHALKTFGYNLSDRFIYLLVQTYDKYGGGDITFDNFVQACVTLSTLTKSFRARDHQNKGSITINYEDFLTLVIGCRPDMKGS